jgi:4-amino-4-deoxy-L-arabinose transferase-like glycosyltransferase
MGASNINVIRSAKAISLYRQLNQPIRQTSALWRYGLFLIVGIFTLTTLVQSLTVPVFEGPDEQRHYAYARYLVNHHALPPRDERLTRNIKAVTYEIGQEVGQPPLYYLVVALVTSPVAHADDADAYVNYNPFTSPSDDAGLPYDNHNTYLHGAEEQFPFQGVALAVHLGRLISVIAGASTLLAVFGIARALLPARPAIGLLATLLMSSVPGVIFLFSVITNDAAVILFATLGVWVAVRIARDGPTRRLALLGGLFSALAVLSKINGAWVTGVVWLALIASALIHCHEQSFRSSFISLILSVGVWILITGWWFGFGVLQNGDPLGISTHPLGATQTLSQLASLTKRPLSDQLTAWDRSIWYSVSWSKVLGPNWLYRIFRYLYLAGLVGAIVTFLQVIRCQRHSPHNLYVQGLQVICLVLSILFAAVLAVLWQLLIDMALGRLFYPGLAGGVILVAIGLAWWLDRLHNLCLLHTIYWVGGAALFILLQYAAIWATTNTIISLTPHSLTSLSPQEITPTQLTFLSPDDSKTPVAELTGYRVHAQDLRAGNAMYADLCWESVGYTQASYPYSLQLVGPNDARPGTRNSYQGLGSYPMSAWKPGEKFCDATSVYIAFSADQPRAYNLVVTLFSDSPPDYKPGPPLSAVDGNGRPVYTVIGRVRVAPGYQPVVTPTISLGDVAGLAGTSIELLPTNTLSVSLRWVALSSPNVNAKVFMHVVDKASSKVIAQSDHEPDGGWFPTNYWQKGDVIDDHFEIALPADTRLDDVTLRLGMYDAKSQARLPAVALNTRQRFTDDAIPFTSLESAR